MRRTAWTLAALLLAFAVWLVASRGRDAAPAISRLGAPQAGAAQATHDERKELALDPSVDDAAQRASVAASVVRGDVRTPTGDPIRGAEITWTAISEANDPASPGFVGWEAAASDTLTATTDDEGAFELAITERHRSGPSVLWATHAGFEPAYRGFADATEATAAPRTIELTPGPAVSATVVDAAGAAVRDADVRYAGLVHAYGDESRPAARARRALRRVWKTNASGQVALPCVEGEIRISAARGDELSRPITGPVEGEVRLVLGATFALQGIVILERGATLEPRAAVQYGAVDERTVDWSAQISVRPDGAFGPERFPLVPGDRYSFMLSGGNLVSQTTIRQAPARNEVVDLRFTGKPARRIAIRVVDELDEPVQGATIRLLASDGVNPTGRSSAAATTAADGSATLLALDADGVCVSGWKDGYAALWFGPVALPEVEREPWVLEMARAGVIEGRVTFEGSPVEEFEIAFWPDIAQFATRRFERAKDGRFVLDGVPLSKHLVYASSEQHPRSEVVAVEFVDGKASVELALAAALTGKGRVIDADTRAPIAGATAEVWNSFRSQLLTQQSPAAVADSDGRFAVVGLREGRNQLWVKAAGYEHVIPSAMARAGELADFGDVPMLRGAMVSVELASDEPVDFTRFTVSSSGVRYFDGVRFDASGRATLGNAIPGALFLNVEYPDGSTAAWRTYLHPGKPWRVRHTVPSGVASFVCEPTRSPCEAVDDLEVAIAYPNEHGEIVYRWLAASVGERRTVQHAPRGPVVFDVGADGRKLARRSLAIDATSEREPIEIELDCARRLLRILDRDDRPASGAELSIVCANAAPRVEQWMTIGPDGEVEIGDPGCDDVLIGVIGECGAHRGIPVSLRGDPTVPQTVRLGPTAALRVRLVDGSTPLPAVWTWAEEAASGLLIDTAYSDAHGVVTWNDVRESEYAILVAGVGLWRTEAKVSCTASDDTPRDVQVRRLGGARFELRDSLGAPAAHASIMLRSVEFHASVDDWVGVGLLTGAPSSMRTDVAGGWSIDGVPRGAYEWEARLGAHAARGAIEIPPGGRAEVSARLE